MKSNLYAKYHAKRDHSGVIIFEATKERGAHVFQHGKVDAKKVKGDFIQVRKLGKRAYDILMSDKGHAFVYEKITAEQAEELTGMAVGSSVPQTGATTIKKEEVIPPAIQNALNASLKAVEKASEASAKATEAAEKAAKQVEVLSKDNADLKKELGGLKEINSKLQESLEAAKTTEADSEEEAKPADKEEKTKPAPKRKK